MLLQQLNDLELTIILHMKSLDSLNSLLIGSKEHETATLKIHCAIKNSFNT